MPHLSTELTCSSPTLSSIQLGGTATFPLSFPLPLPLPLPFPRPWGFWMDGRMEEDGLDESSTTFLGLPRFPAGFGMDGSFLGLPRFLVGFWMEES